MSTAKEEVERVVKYCCPECGRFRDSNGEADEHCTHCGAKMECLNEQGED